MMQRTMRTPKSANTRALQKSTESSRLATSFHHHASVFPRSPRKNRANSEPNFLPDKSKIPIILNGRHPTVHLVNRDNFRIRYLVEALGAKPPKQFAYNSFEVTPLQDDNLTDSSVEDIVFNSPLYQRRRKKSNNIAIKKRTSRVNFDWKDDDADEEDLSDCPLTPLNEDEGIFAMEFEDNY